MALITKEIWSHPKTPATWDKIVKRYLGLSDEIFLMDYIKNFGKKVVVCDLGIGTGRLLKEFDKFKNISEIIGIDYSKPMLSFCQKRAQKCKKKVILLEEDIKNLVNLEKEVAKIKKPIIYICLLNTFGNFLPQERKLVLQKIKNLMKKEDRLILCLYKRPEKAVIEAINLPPYLKIKSKRKKVKLAEIIEYTLYPTYWHPVLDKFNQPPRFWYDEKENDIAIYVEKEKVFISHRFSKEEIKELGKITGLKLEKLIEGKLMYIVIFKINKLMRGLIKKF